jgi:MurNAc alpha-1-phosphate uridylyltransferase
MTARPDSPAAAMVFAAGFGTRMGALTRDRPKPLIPVAGRPLLDHAIAIAQAAAPRIVVNTHYRGDMIAAHLAGRDIALSPEPDVILDTGGGLRAALPLLGPGPVFTLNSDAVWKGGNPLLTLAAAWDGSRMEGLLLLLDRDRAIGHSGQGDFLTDAQGRLARGPGRIYSGAQILRTEDLAAIPGPAFSLNLLWDRMIARGTLFGLTWDGQWCDVGRPESIPLAEALLGHG